jgi:RND family efflux transporter MFP subunit
MNIYFKSIALIAGLSLATACDHPHSHDGDARQVHEGGAEHEHGGLVEHGHEPGAIAVTHFTDTTELFVEYPPLVVGEDSAFAAHLTRLDDFRPVQSGRLTVILSGGGLPEERFQVESPSVPGIFRPVATPKRAGRRNLALVLEADETSVVHDLGIVAVFSDGQQAAAAQPHEEGETGEIQFLKEQQWKVDFATAEVRQRSLRPSVHATGIIKARSDGEALVSSPAAGYLVPGTAFPRLGIRVSVGDPLAIVAPRVAGEVDVASLELELERARSRLDLAQREQSRVADLVEQQAAPQRRLNEAENAERVARAEAEAAANRLNQFQRNIGTTPGSDKGQFTVRAPISGVLADIRVAAGGYVEQGQAMFHIVDTTRLWLEANVAEVDLGRLGDVAGAWFQVDGFDQSFEVSPATGGKLVAQGGVIDPVSRTAPVVFEFPNDDRQLRVGMFAHAHIWTGKDVEAPAVPYHALIDEAGQDVIYVMTGGESFERRVVRLGIRDGDYVQVESGVEDGERIVTRGAYLVRLAAASPAEAGHGHAH